MNHNEEKEKKEKNRLFSNAALKKLIIPLVIEQGLAISVGMIDTIMISSAGESAVSGVSLIDMLAAVIITIFGALATGGAVVVAQYMGAGEEKKTQASVQQVLAVSLVISVVLTAILLILRAPIMRLLFGAVEQSVWDNAMLYLLITAFSFPFIAMYSAGAALFRAVGNSKVSMITSLISNIINFLGNAAFLFLCHWGVFGVALATLLARGVAMVVVLVLLAKKNQKIWWNIKEKYKPDWTIIKRVLGIGIPNSLENSSFQLGKIIIMSIVAGFGTSHITANAMGNNLAAMGCIPGNAMGLAILTVVGQCVGARDEEQIRYYSKKLMGIGYLIGGVLNLMILAVLPWVIQVYNVTPETREIAMKLIWIHNGFAILFWPSSFTLPNCLRASNDVRFTMVVSIFSMAMFRVLFSYILGVRFGMGVVGVWIAMVMDWVFRSTLFFIRIRGPKWIEKGLARQSA